MHRQEPASVNLDTLVKLFYSDVAELGQFDEISDEQMPPVYKNLLAHDGHMTVTVEAHHQQPVDVIVLDRNVTSSLYARKIVLCRQHDQEVVQFGLMRVNFAHLRPDVREAIEREDTPLGRILIEHDVLRTVQLVSLYRVGPGNELKHYFGLQSTEGASNGRKPTTCYGRTAIIFCSDEPAVELLEIVVPEPAT